MIFTRGLEHAERLCLCSLDPTQPNFIFSGSPIYASTSNLLTRLGRAPPSFCYASTRPRDRHDSPPVTTSLGHIRAQCRPKRGRCHGFDPARGLVTRSMFRSLTTQTAPTGRPLLAHVQAAPSWWAATDLAASVLPPDRPGQWDTQDQQGCSDSLGREACLGVWMPGFDNGQWTQSPACRRSASFALDMARTQASSRRGRSSCKVPAAGRQGSPGTAGSSEPDLQPSRHVCRAAHNGD